MTAGTRLGTGDTRQSRRHGFDASALGGLGAVLGGLCWVGKGGAILVSGVQPVFVFELAPLLMALSAVVLAQQLAPSVTRKRAELMAWAACIAGTVVAANEALPLHEAVAGTAMAAAHLAILAVLIVAGTRIRQRLEGVVGSLPLALGLGTIPALLVGGALTAVLGERALELPILALGLTWGVFGVFLATSRYRIRPAQ